MRDRPVSAPAIAPAIAPVTVPVTVPVTTMVRHDAIDAAALRARLRDGGLTLAGNRRLKIYGRLDCPAGRRMKRGSRVFFTNRTAAEDAGYRPCGRCCRGAYDVWKSKLNSGI